MSKIDEKMTKFLS